MKKTNIFGAVLCSAALAMGMAMPAFAAANNAGDVDTATNSIKTSGNSADTAVNVLFSQTQINAEVPVSIAIGVEDGAQKAIVTPTAGKFAVSNNSASATLYVTGVEAQATGTDFTLVENPASTKGNASAEYKAQVALNLAANGTTVNLSKAAFTNTVAGTTLQAAAGGKIALDLSGTSTTSAKITAADAFNAAAYKLTITISSDAPTA